MTNLQQKQRYEIGMIDLFFMGRILVLNLINLSLIAADYKKDKPLRKEIAERSNRTFANILDCIKLLCKPNSMMVFVPAGSPADSVIKNVSEHFKLDDFSLVEVQLCLTRFNTKNTLQKSRLKLILERM
ncbi:MAG: hypothetical protein ACYDA4_16225 [Ignavibacteriaceae bacterium]